MTLSDVAEHTLLSWDTVKAITKTHLAKDYGKPPLQGVRYLGIDEIHLGKKKHFYTIVIDLEDGRILWAKPGRGKAALRGFWRRLRLVKTKIKAVVIINIARVQELQPMFKGENVVVLKSGQRYPTTRSLREIQEQLEFRSRD